MFKRIIKGLLKYPLMLLNRIYTYLYYKKSDKREKYNIDEMFQGEQKVLVLAPHVDDETIGLGATLLKFKKSGTKMALVYMSDGGGSTSSLTRKEIIQLRKKEGEDIKNSLGFDSLYFLDEPDGQVNSSNNELIDKLIGILNKENPTIIFSPFLIDGHSDHVETTKSLMRALGEWNNAFKNIYMYEVNCPILPKVVNSLSLIDENLYREKERLFKKFKSQSVMGFSAFTLLNRMKRLMTDNEYGAEVFVKLEISSLNKAIEGLELEGFKPEYFRQLSSEYNLLLTFRKGKDLKEKYSLIVNRVLEEELALKQNIMG